MNVRAHTPLTTLDIKSTFNDEVVSGIYQLRFGSNRFYIGLSQDINKRLSQHLRVLTLGEHTQSMQDACNEVGIDNIAFAVLEKCHPDILIEREVFWIIRCRGYDLLNYQHKTPHDKSTEIKKTSLGVYKPIEVFDPITGTVVGEFYNMNVLHRLGASKGRISDVINGKKPYHKGFVFRRKGANR